MLLDRLDPSYFPSSGRSVERMQRTQRPFPNGTKQYRCTSMMVYNMDGSHAERFGSLWAEHRRSSWPNLNRPSAPNVLNNHFKGNRSRDIIFILSIGI